MAKENIRRTRITVALIIVGAVIMLATVGVVFIFPSLKSRLSPGYLQDELSSGKYVSLSGLERGDSVYVYDNYLVKRSREGWGTDRIEIYSTNPRTELRDFLTFMIFDSHSDAKKFFDNDHDYVTANNVKFEDEGSNWFIAEWPGVCDAQLTKMYYLIDNVIITADVEATYYSTWSDPDETTASTLSRKGLRVYIKDNAKDLRRFVLTEIMSEAKIKAAEESKNGSD